MEGYVKKIVAEKGYGFIQCAGLPDLFFHCTELENLEFDERLIERRVRFRIENHFGRDRAVRVQPAD